MNEEGGLRVSQPVSRSASTPPPQHTHTHTCTHTRTGVSNLPVVRELQVSLPRSTTLGEDFWYPWRGVGGGCGGIGVMGEQGRGMGGTVDNGVTG